MSARAEAIGQGQRLWPSDHRDFLKQDLPSAFAAERMISIVKDNYPENLKPRFDAGCGVEEPFEEWWPKVALDALNWARVTTHTTWPRAS
jgi:hypothetical protein